MRRKREVIYDFKLGEAGETSVDENSDDEVLDVATPPTLGSDDLFTDESRTLMLQHLLQKGFCLVGLGGTHQQMVDAARLDALKLLQENEGNNFTAPPFMVADGLLGEEGSAEIMQMEGFNFTAQQKPGLGSADAFLTQIFTAVSPLETMLECRLSSRSSCILHKAGIPKDSDVPELTPKECHKWLGVFGHSRLMLVLFLGPGYGRMEFQPLDVDVDSIELDVGPGTLLLLRADGLTHRFFSTARSLALSCFLMEDASQTWRRRFGTPLLVTPVCRDLMDWAKERWEHSRRSQPIGEGLELDPNMPRQWQKMSSQVFQLGPQVAVRGTSCKMPASYSDAGFWCGAEAGCDLIEEVPLCRWDHSNFYDKDVESYKWAKTSCLHGSFIDGIELFDNKFFGISPVESRGMDPMQRHILETSYEALYFSGFQKKSLMRSLIGVYIGAATSEFAFAPQDDCSMSGTGGANSITSNRISFCLGLQGPSFTVDAQGAAALAALTNGAMSLRFQTDLYKPNHAALVGGVYLMLTGSTWILLSAKGHLSPQGRCLSFDQSADGYVKSEGVANLVLTLLSETEDSDEVETKGIIAATHANHTGRGASLTAPCGPQQGELIQQALRQAAIAPATVDAVECFSQGRLMQDAVEAEVAKRTLRGYDSHELPLALSSGFTQSGMSLEAAGMAQILKVLVTQKYGTILPSLHLQQLNPQIEEPSDQDCVLFASEHLQLEGLSSYHGLTGQSLGGTMCHVITLGNVQVESEKVPAVEEGGQAGQSTDYVTTREAQQLAASKFWLPKMI